MGTDGGESGAAGAQLVERRLRMILQALDGRDVGENGQELWFRPGMAHELQIRLGADAGASSYDRSANFGISYGGEGSVAPSALRAVIDRIKALDAVPIAGVAA